MNAAGREIGVADRDCLAGGVVDTGETSARTAVRELAEKLGIVLPADAAPLPRWPARPGMASQGAPMRCHLFAYELLA